LDINFQSIKSKGILLSHETVGIYECALAFKHHHRLDVFSRMQKLSACASIYPQCTFCHREQVVPGAGHVAIWRAKGRSKWLSVGIFKPNSRITTTELAYVQNYVTDSNQILLSDKPPSSPMIGRKHTYNKLKMADGRYFKINKS